MATTVLNSAPPSASISAAASSAALIARNVGQMRTRSYLPTRRRIEHLHRHLNLAIRLPCSGSVLHFMLFASDGEAAETDQNEIEEHVPDSELEENIGGVNVGGDTLNEIDNISAEQAASALMNALQSYREAMADNDESKVAEVESFLKLIENEKIKLEGEILTLTEELLSEKDRVFRITADFNNFRRRTERERLSLVTTAQGEVIEKLLPVLDEFERAKTEIKAGTEREKKINNSYESIYKQYVEILVSLGVTSLETTANPLDPLARLQMIGKSFEKLRRACSGFMKRT